MGTYTTSEMAKFQLALGRNPDIASQIQPTSDDQKRQLEKLTEPIVQEMISLAIEKGEDIEHILRKINIYRNRSGNETVVNTPSWFEEEEPKQNHKYTRPFLCNNEEIRRKRRERELIGCSY